MSIIYESNLKNSQNLYLITLKNVKGQAPPVSQEGMKLKLSLRFQNNPRPSNFKIYGISDLMEENKTN